MCDQSLSMAPINGSFEFAPSNPNSVRPTQQGYELRASRMYMNCDCRKRNGLQDNCPMTMCNGSTNEPNQMQNSLLQYGELGGHESQMRGFESPNFSRGQNNGGPMSYGAPMSGYQEYFGDGFPVGPAMQTYPSGQMGGMPMGSSWAGVQQGHQPCNY